MNAQSFFTELKRLATLFPKSDGLVKFSENVYYSNYIYDSKNLLYCYDTAGSQNGIYLFDSFMCVDCIDCDYTVEAENCYECRDAFKVYNCDHIEDCDSMRDSAYCFDCGNLENCFGCAYLSNKYFCIFNRQVTEAQYYELVKKYRALPSERIWALVEDVKKRFPKRPVISENSVNSPYGNYIHHSKNCYMCFDAAHDEDCAYLYDSFYNKFCFDMTYSSRYSEFTYQAIESARLNNCAYALECNTAQDSAYIINCNDVRNCFGCVGLRRKEYCILNRQFSQEEYERILPVMKKEVFNSGMGWGDLIY